MTRLKGMATAAGLAVALTAAAACSDNAERKADAAAEDAARAADHAGEAASEATRDAARAADRATEEAGAAVSEAAADAERATERSGDAIENAAKDAGNAVSNAATAAGRAVGNAAKATEAAVMEGGRAGDAAVETMDVKVALTTDTRVDASHINVDTNHETRTVTLKGSVPSASQKSLAAEIATAKARGYRVVNTLTVGKS